MNELYTNKLSILAQDEILISAIKEVFNEVIENERPTVKDADNNNLLGEKYRAYVEAKRIIANGFQNIKSYKLENKPSKKFNKER